MKKKGIKLTNLIIILIIGAIIFFVICNTLFKDKSLFSITAKIINADNEQSEYSHI